MTRAAAAAGVVRLVVATACWCAGVRATAARRDGGGGGGGFGTVLYGPADASRARWTDRGRAELQCRMLVGRLVPARTPDDGGASLIDYYRLVGAKAAEVGGTRLRATVAVAVADALGGYAYAEALPRARMSYYEGRADYATTKRLHDLVERIKYVLDTDGRGWARPVAAAAQEPDAAVAEKATARMVAGLVIGGIGRGPPDGARCGGVDAGPYGLRRPRSDDEAAWTDDRPPLPFFDDDARPHSLVVPWRPGRPVLYGVHDAACHRALFDHCARSAAAAATARAPPEGHATAADRYARDLSAWLDAAARPLVTPAAAAGRWYPGLWAVRPVARLLSYEAGPDGGHRSTADDGRPPPAVPNACFYAAVVLTCAAAVWTVGGCVLFRGGRWLRCLCAAFGHALCFDVGGSGLE